MFRNISLPVVTVVGNRVYLYDTTDKSSCSQKLKKTSVMNPQWGERSSYKLIQWLEICWWGSVLEAAVDDAIKAHNES